MDFFLNQDLKSGFHCSKTTAVNVFESHLLCTLINVTKFHVETDLHAVDMTCSFLLVQKHSWQSVIATSLSTAVLVSIGFLFI